MNPKAIAGQIVLGINDEKWQETEAKIAAALIEAYNLGAQSMLNRLAAEAEKPGCGDPGCVEHGSLPAEQPAAPIWTPQLPESERILREQEERVSYYKREYEHRQGCDLHWHPPEMNPRCSCRPDVGSLVESCT